MSRTTITVTDEVHERLEAHKQDDESWSDVGARAADALESQDEDVNTDPNSVVATNVDEIALACAGEVEDRMTGY